MIVYHSEERIVFAFLSYTDNHKLHVNNLKNTFAFFHHEIMIKIFKIKIDDTDQ